MLNTMLAAAKTTPTALLDSALALAAQGLAVFPCRADKRPACARGFIDASKDPERVRQLFTGSGAELIGIATGAASGLDVVDVDPRHQGGAWWDANVGQVPFTRIHTTRSGGFHVLLRHHPGMRSSQNSIAQGVDVRADGGYAIWWPVHGCVPFLDEELSKLASWPEWLRPAAVAKPAATVVREHADHLAPPSEQAVVDLLNRLPNPLAAGRDTYSAVMLAASGCAHITGDEGGEIAAAATAWAERWESYDGTDEQEKWERDWSGRPIKTGWPTLERVARELIPGYALEKAGTEFPTLPPEPAPLTDRAITVLPGELPQATTAAERALIESGLPVFQRGSSLVQPITQTVDASKGRKTVAASLKVLNSTHLVDILTQVAIWRAPEGPNRPALKRIDAPKAVAETLLSRAGRWAFPRVVGVITTPSLRPDGSVLAAPGYDAATEIYHEADPAIILTPEVQQPTRADAERALQTLVDLLAEFPFISDVSRAVALSGLITPVVRGAMTVVPLHAMRASTAGTGKSYLVDVAGAIASGRPCPVSSVGKDEAEQEKRINGLLLHGFPVACLDNVNGELGGDLLCQAIERPTVRIRPLGGSSQVEVEPRWTLFCTGNNLRVRGDMTRRTLVCDLDAGVERPELRPFNAKPVDLVTADRGRYVSACLIIARAYALAGRPGKLPPLASFEGWSDTVRSALVWLGSADPAASMQAARDDDPDLIDLRDFLSAWCACHGAGSVLTVKELIETSVSGSEFNDGGQSNGEVLQECLQRAAGTRGVAGTINAQRLGVWLANHKGRIVDGLRVQVGPKRNNVSRWKLERVNAE